MLKTLYTFLNPEIGGNVFSDFIFTIGNPPPHPGRICTQPAEGHFGHPRKNTGTHSNLISQVFPCTNFGSLSTNINSEFKNLTICWSNSTNTR